MVIETMINTMFITLYFLLSSFNTSNVTTMESMFSKASSLKNIYIGPEWVTAANTSSMFYSCGTKL